MAVAPTGPAGTQSHPALSEDGRAGEEAAGERIAVLIPCLNEERTVADVIREFHRELPHAQVWVVDNGSTDRTIEIATAAGAHVLREPRRGKGFAIRAAFRDIEADVYVLADGDSQLPAESVHALIAPVLDGSADMVVGSRARGGTTSARAVNRIGNVLFSRVLRNAFGVEVTDVLSGYRALSRLLVKTLPLAARNFEIEVELTIKTSERRYRIREVPYRVRPRAGATASHLRVARDGIQIGWAILLLFRDYRPMAFFGLFGVLLLVLALIAYRVTGIGDPDRVLVAGFLAGAALLSFASGLILSVIARRFQEVEGKVDMVTTLGLARDPLERRSHRWPPDPAPDHNDVVQSEQPGNRSKQTLADSQ